MMKKILLICLSIFCLVGCDYSSKNIAKDKLKGQPVHSYLGGNIELVYAENSGGLLSLGNDLPNNLRVLIFKIFVTLAMCLLFFYTVLKKGIRKWSLVALILIISGGVGNLIDRIMNEGKVVDFIVMSLNNFHTGIFNIADVYVTIGIIILIFSEIVISPTIRRIQT
ncbi:MAG: signal peptidase II [Ignavibacteriaceae bacterium]|jgi:signal peptidase II